MNNDYPPLLTLDEERSLLAELVAYRESGDQPRYLERRERLALANLRLVRSMIHRHTGNESDVEDLMQAGFLGLLRAIDGYDPRRANGGRFATTARWWVRSKLSRAVKASAKETTAESSSWALDDLVVDEEPQELAPGVDVGNILAVVTAHQRQVLEMAYGLNGRKPAMLKEVAAELGTSQANVSGIKRDAEARIRKRFERPSVYLSGMNLSIKGGN